MAGPDPFPHAEVRAAITALGNARHDLTVVESAFGEALNASFQDWEGATFDEFAHANLRRHDERRHLDDRLATAITTLRTAAQEAG